MRVLCVAEKPSISKAVAGILSGGHMTTRTSPVPFIKNYDFNYPQKNWECTFTCVCGHLTEHDFPETHRKWHTCDPFALFDAPVVTSIAGDKKGVAKNLENEARRHDMLMIWTDCDREGENIGAEVMRVCRKANPRIQVTRARFSAIIGQQIHHAAQHPVPLDMQQADAVEARILLDLRTGAAFTRMQTLALQARFPQIQDHGQPVSYGPCQFPTLGFVVSRWLQVKAFRPETFWYIYLALTRDGKESVFAWRRGHLFEEAVAVAIYQMVMANTEATVASVVQKETKKWRPFPLTTVELQKAGSRLLHLAPKKVLDIAEKLYQQGFLSYPRTETDQFDPAFDFMTLIEKQTPDQRWGQFATQLQNGGFSTPKRGKNNDKAHPPIHPTAHAPNLGGDEKRVYEFIVRRFLACCSKDAIGAQTTIEVVCGGEEFYATGLVVLAKNYLEVYIYDKWLAKTVPQFAQGEKFQPSTLELRDGQTTSPTLLTEADLVSLMDKNGIGTDATIAEHIAKVVEREYVLERMEGQTKYLTPSKLGIGLIEGYNAIQFDKSLSKPQLRRDTERSMVQVCEGNKSKTDMMQENVEQYKQIFMMAKQQFPKVVESVGKYLLGANAAGRGGAARGRGVARGGGAAPRGGGGGPPRGGGAGGNAAPRGGAARGGRGGGRGGAPPAAAREESPPSDMDEDDYGAPPPPRAKAPVSRQKPAAPAPAPVQRPPPSRAPAPPLPKPPTSNRTAADPNAPDCKCGVPASRQKIVAESMSKGREFWSCGKPLFGEPKTCMFFVFTDGPMPQQAKANHNTNASTNTNAYASGSGPGGAANNVPAKRTYSNRSQAQDDGAERLCDCKLPAIQRTVTKEGDNTGRMFWTCPQPQTERCKYFVWEDEAPGAARTNGGGGSGGGTSQSTGECFKCHQEGHWSNNCPNDGAAPNKRQKSFGGDNGGGGSGQVCFKCNEEGHFANACPNPSGGSSGAYSKSKGKAAATGGGGGGKGECFNCGDGGHWSNDCPTTKGGGGASSRAPSRSGSGSTARGGGAKRGKGSRGGARGRGASARGGKRGAKKKAEFFGAPDD